MPGEVVYTPGYNSEYNHLKQRGIALHIGDTNWRGTPTDRAEFRIHTKGERTESCYLEYPDFEDWVQRLHEFIQSPEYQAIKLQQAVRNAPQP